MRDERLRIKLRELCNHLEKEEKELIEERKLKKVGYTKGLNDGMESGFYLARKWIEEIMEETVLD